MAEIRPFPISRSARWVRSLADLIAAKDGEAANVAFRNEIAKLGHMMEDSQVPKTLAEAELTAFANAVFDRILARARSGEPCGGAA
jgi:hypothetical protein